MGIRFRDKDNKLLYEYYRLLGLNKDQAIALAVYTFGDTDCKDSLYAIAKDYYTYHRETDNYCVADHIGKQIHAVISRNHSVYVEDALKYIEPNRDNVPNNFKRHPIGHSNRLKHINELVEYEPCEYEPCDVFNMPVKNKADHNIVIIAYGDRDKWIQAGIISILTQCTRYDRISLLAFGCKPMPKHSNDVHTFIDDLFEIGRLDLEHEDAIKDTSALDSLFDSHTISAFHVNQIVILENISGTRKGKPVHRNEYNKFLENVYSEYIFRKNGVIVSEMDASKESLESFIENKTKHEKEQKKERANIDDTEDKEQQKQARKRWMIFKRK